MRIKVKLKCDKLPMIYSNRILAMIKTALSYSNEEYLKELYNNFHSKPFTYSIDTKHDKAYLNKAWLSINQNMILNENVFKFKDGTANLLISSSDDKFMFNLISGFHKMNSFEFSTLDSMRIDNKKVFLSIIDIQVIKEPEINNIVTFNTLRPFLFNDINKQPVIFSDSNFHEQMNNTTKKLLSTYGYDLKSDIYLENIDLKKTVVKTVNSGTLQTNQPILTFTSNTGNLKLIGDKKALELIYKNGFGIKSSQGFGMLEVV